MKNKQSFQYHEVQIKSKVQITADTFLFCFNGKQDFEPGQFVQVALDHYGEATFAPCSDSADKKTFELCIRACGNTTNQLVKLLPGDKIKIRGPYGKSWPMAKLIGKEIVLVAGGIGLIPIMPVLYQLNRYSSDFKKIHLIAGFKTEDHVLFRDKLENFAKKIDIQICTERKPQNPFYKQGMITDPLKLLKFNPKKTMALLCGPEVMFSFCNNVLKEKDLAEENIYISFERRMECGIGVCQHCNIGRFLVCEDGPVFPYNIIKDEIGK